MAFNMTLSRVINLLIPKKTSNSFGFKKVLFFFQSKTNLITEIDCAEPAKPELSTIKKIIFKFKFRIRFWWHVFHCAHDWNILSLFSLTQNHYFETLLSFKCDISNTGKHIVYPLTSKQKNWNLNRLENFCAHYFLGISRWQNWISVQIIQL